MKKVQNQGGRSMIEMLGVLAIIAVLSVGGIAGYSKAMIKFKVNKTVEQVTHIVTGIMTAFANQKGYSGTRSQYGFTSYVEGDLEMLETLGIVSKADIVDGKLKHPFNKDLGIDGAVNAGKKEILIFLYDLTREVCLSLATIDWGNNSQNFSGIVAGDGRNIPNVEACGAGGSGATITEGYALVCRRSRHGKAFVPLPMPPDIAAKGCSCKKSGCYIGLVYEENI